MSSNLQWAMRRIKLSVKSGTTSTLASNGNVFNSAGSPNVVSKELPTPPASPFESVRLLDPFGKGSQSTTKAKETAAKPKSVTNFATPPSASDSESSRPAKQPFDSVRLKDPFATPKESKADRQKGAEPRKDGRAACAGASRVAELA